MRRFAAMLVLVPAASLGSAPFDASGTWQMVELECLASEMRCLEKISAVALPAKVHLPVNLRETLPWFSGRVCFERMLPEADALLIGGTSPIDSVSGSAENLVQDWREGRVPDLWNQPALLRIAARSASEPLRICVIALDEKAGIHRGPLLAGRRAELLPLLHREEILYRFLPAGISLFAAATALFLLTAFLIGLLPRGFGFFAGGMIPYVIFSLYGSGLIPAVDTLFWIRVSLTAGASAAIMNLLFYLEVLGLSSPFLRICGAILLVTTAVLHALPDGIAATLTLARGYHGFVTACFVVVAGLLVRTRLKRPDLHGPLLFLLPASLAGAAASFWDFLVRNHAASGQFLSNHASGLYFMMVQVFIVYLMHSARKKADEYRARIDADRGRIARQLHGAVGSDLALLIVELDAAAARNRELQPLVVQTRSVLERLRHVVHVLGKAGSPRSVLEDEIRGFLEQLKTSSLLQVKVDVPPFTAALKPETILHIQFALREWISNVVRHSDAGFVRIRWRERNRSGVLSVYDNGKGFARGVTGGLGLANLDHYAAAAGGRWRAVRLPAGGTVFCFVFPRTTG